MTAPTLNGTRYPQPVSALLPAARDIELPEGQRFPSRNRLMREFRIGAPKADELLALLRAEVGFQPVRDPWDYAEPIGPDPLPTPVAPESVPLVEPVLTPAPAAPPVEPSAEVAPVSHPGTPPESKPRQPLAVWPVILLALPAFVAIWSGWVELGELAGFGVVHPLPGIWDGFSINSAITLPIGVETYSAYASYVWLSGRASARLLTFAKWSAIASLLVGALGQVAYHLLAAAGVTSAPWQITTAVACLPVAVFGMGAGLAHLVREDAKR